MQIRLPKFIAAVLAIGGCVWAFLLGLIALAAMGSGDVGTLAKLGMIFGVGFVVWIGWALRAVTSFPVVIRSRFWIASISVNLGYLLFFSLSFGMSFKDTIHFWWWPFAASLSLIAFFADRNEKIA
jgi:hypothetical protein